MTYQGDNTMADIQAIHIPTIEYVKALAPSFAIIGSVVVALLAYHLNREAEKETRLQEQINLASAFYGEISAIVSLINRNRYAKEYAGLARRIMRADNVSVLPRYTGEAFSLFFRRMPTEWAFYQSLFLSTLLVSIQTS
jgi:hypothetical protein